MSRTMTPDEFADRLNKMVRTGALTDVLVRTAHTLHQNMKTEAKFNVTGKVLNVRTGKLRQSIDHHSGVKQVQRGVRAFVGAGGRRAFYAKFHERGKRPFLAPARDQVIKTAPRVFEREALKTFKEAGLGT